MYIFKKALKKQEKNMKHIWEREREEKRTERNNQPIQGIYNGIKSNN